MYPPGYVILNYAILEQMLVQSAIALALTAVLAASAAAHQIYNLPISVRGTLTF